MEDRRACLPEDVAALQKVIPASRTVDYLSGTLLESLLTLASTRTLLVLDSSFMHFADVLGVPAVAVFLKDEPSTVVDRRSCIQPVFEPRFPCQPCGLAVCDQPAIYCLDTVDPAVVAKRILAERGRATQSAFDPLRSGQYRAYCYVKLKGWTGVQTFCTPSERSIRLWRLE